jgi:pimeloyl-ACP methyl ester carboxylesterase
MVEGAGVELAVTEVGEGPAVLVVHGIASDALTWADALSRLAAAGARAIAFDRRGYGSSGAPQPYGATTAEEQAEDAVAVLRALAAVPAVVVGDGFGALVALDLMKRHPGVVAGAVLSDPPLFAFVPDAGEALSEQRVVLEDALRSGGPEAAVEAWLGGRLESEPLARARAAHQAFFADFAGLASWPVTRRELRGMSVPAVVVTDAAAPAHVAAAADAVAGLLPSATREVGGDVVAAALGLVARSPSPHG